MSDSESQISQPPLLISLVRRMLKPIGSLWLTVAILAALIAILLWGTVTEKDYGATAAKFGIYGSWWFNALGLLLGLNSASSLVLRLPWKRQHLGFVVPHIGLIVLLVGCYLSRRYGIEATLSVFEGQTSDLAYKGPAQHVELDGQQRFHLKVISDEGPESAGQESGRQESGDIVVPFTSGPFNWSDYDDGTLGRIPWSLAHRDRGVLYDHDGICLEVLDYLSNSEITNLPRLAVEAVPLGPDGSETAEQSQVCRFSVKSDAGSDFARHRFGVGSEQSLASGQRILFWMTGRPDETAAFRQSKPAGPLGKLGRVLLYAGGKSYDWPIDDWKRGTRRALGDSGLEAELVDRSEGRIDLKAGAVVDAQVRLKIHHGSQSHPLVLSAEFPELSDQDYPDNVFGTYWCGQPEKPNDPPPSKSDAGSKDASAKGESADARPAFAPPRIDFFQGADQRLYLRAWRAGKVLITGPLKFGDSGGRITAFRGTPDALTLTFGDFQPASQPGYSARPLAFNKEDDPPHLRQAYVRLTIDQQPAEFWMPCSSPDQLESLRLAIPEKLLKKTVVGKGRRVELTFAPESFHIGYTVSLHKAWRKLDPGTRQASFYGSEIDLAPNEHAVSSEQKALDASGRPAEYDNLLVTLNAPLDFADPAHPGRSYRMFQATMNGPYNPEEVGLKLGEPAYLSGFTLNYDPGRGVTYIGCLLIVGGIFIAYFVRLAGPRRRAPQGGDA